MTQKSIIKSSKRVPDRNSDHGTQKNQHEMFPTHFIYPFTMSRSLRSLRGHIHHKTKAPTSQLSIVQ